MGRRPDIVSWSAARVVGSVAGRRRIPGAARAINQARAWRGARVEEPRCSGRPIVLSGLRHLLSSSRAHATVRRGAKRRKRWGKEKRAGEGRMVSGHEPAPPWPHEHLRPSPRSRHSGSDSPPDRTESVCHQVYNAGYEECHSQFGTVEGPPTVSLLALRRSFLANVAPTARGTDISPRLPPDGRFGTWALPRRA